MVALVGPALATLLLPPQPARHKASATARVVKEIVRFMIGLQDTIFLRSRRESAVMEVHMPGQTSKLRVCNGTDEAGRRAWVGRDAGVCLATTAAGGSRGHDRR